MNQFVYRISIPARSPVGIRACYGKRWGRLRVAQGLFGTWVRLRKAGTASLRVGVIGVGVMGSNHARVLSELPGVKLVGVADPDRKRCEHVARTLGCAAFADAEALDAPRRRCRHDRGAHATASRHRASTAPRAASTCWSKSRSPRRSRRAAPSLPRRAAPASRLMVGHVERFNPAVQSIKRAIKDQDILSIAITRVGPFPPRMSNVGVVIDLAVHDIDLIRWFTDSEIVEIQPQTSSAVAEREDIALLQFRTASGVLAHINTNWLTPFKARTIHIATRDKYLIGDLLTLQVTECFGFQPDGSYSMRHLSVGYAEPLRSELVAFVSAIRSGEPPRGDRRGRRRQPRNRHPLPRRAHGAATAPQRKGAAAGRRLNRSAGIDNGRIRSDMNQHTRVDERPIPFIDVAAQRRRLGSAIDDAVARVLAHCQFIQGPEVRALEAELAAFCGAGTPSAAPAAPTHCCSSCMAWEIGPGDAVICPSFTFHATAEMVALCSARRRLFADVDAGHVQSRSGKLRARGRRRQSGWVSSRARSFRSICSACRPITTRLPPSPPRTACWCSTMRRRLSARAIVAASSARWPTATATSFFPAKPLGCYGDGGAVFTDDDALAARVKSIRLHGEGVDRYDAARIGITGRLDTIQAAVLIEKLKIFPDEIAARNRVARAMRRRLPTSRSCRASAIESTSVWAQYTIRLKPGGAMHLRRR